MDLKDYKGGKYIICDKCGFAKLRARPHIHKCKIGNSVVQIKGKQKESKDE